MRACGRQKAAWLAAALLLALILPRAAALADGAGKPAPALPMKARFAQKSVAAGDEARLDLSFSLPEGAKLAEPITVRGLSSPPLSVKRTEGGLEVSLLADSLGSFRVDALTLDFTGKDGKPGTFKSEPAAVSVTTQLASNPAAQSPRPAKDILRVGFPWRRWLVPALAAALLAAAGFGLLRYLRRRRTRLETIIRIPPHETALAALAALENEEGLEPKDFAFRISLVLRAYMESLRGFPAVEMTTEEIAQKSVLEEDRGLLPVLRETDLAKFAEFVLSQDDRSRQIALVRSYVEATRPRPETPGASPEAAP